MSLESVSPFTSVNVSASEALGFEDETETSIPVVIPPTINRFRCIAIWEAFQAEMQAKENSATGETVIVSVWGGT